MGIYFDRESASDFLITEEQRQGAVDRLRPLRFRGQGRFEEIVEAAASAYDAAIAAISIVDRDEQVFVARTGMADWATPRSESFCALAIQRPGEPLVVPDARLDARFAARASVVSPGGIRFYAGITIVDVFGYPLGALCVVDFEPRYDRVDTTALAMMARAVERAFGEG